MEELMYETMMAYFDIVKKFGYCNYIKIMPIFALSFIDELLSSDYVLELNNDDINDIKQAINTMSNNNYIIEYAIRKNKE